jgi:hypothetical protein
MVLEQILTNSKVVLQCLIDINNTVKLPYKEIE